MKFSKDKYGVTLRKHKSNVQIENGFPGLAIIIWERFLNSSELLMTHPCDVTAKKQRKSNFWLH